VEVTPARGGDHHFAFPELTQTDIRA
jgi:hypothetical protein